MEYEKLRKMNGLRNAIVHAYDSLMVEEIYDNYQTFRKSLTKNASQWDIKRYKLCYR